MIELTLHPKHFASKPSGKEAGAISLRIASYPKTLSLQAFADALESGQTWSALFGDCPKTGKPSRSRATWRAQQVFAADLDKGDHALAEVLTIASNANIKPCIIHRTFSYTESEKKWRVITILDSPITNSEQALAYQRYLADSFGADPAVVDVSRLYYGCRKGDIAYLELVHDSLKQLQKEVRTESVNIGKSLPLLNRSERALLQGTIAYCAQCLAQPESSRYMAIWHSGRRLGQLQVLDADTIAEFIAKLALKSKPSLYTDYDKPIEKIAKLGAIWGLEHNG